MNIKDLAKQIKPRWRVQSYSKKVAQAICMGYIDARDVMNVLDEVVGPQNWQDKYEFVGSKLIAGIGIKDTVTGAEWIWKFDTGTSGSIENEKSIFSDAFKRAAVKWGIGRFLYDLDTKIVKANIVKTDTNYPYPVDEQGNHIWDLTKYFNEKPTPSTSSTTKPVNQSNISLCPIHKEVMKKHEKGKDVWFSHLLKDGSYCNGK